MTTRASIHLQHHVQAEYSEDAVPYDNKEGGMQGRSRRRPRRRSSRRETQSSLGHTSSALEKDEALSGLDTATGRGSRRNVKKKRAWDEVEVGSEEGVRWKKGRIGAQKVIILP